MIYPEWAHQSVAETVYFQLRHEYKDICRNVGYLLVKLVSVAWMVRYLVCVLAFSAGPQLVRCEEIVFLMWLHQCNPWYV